MKKILIITSLLLLGFVYSCDKKNSPIEPNTTVELRASVEPSISDTKTSLGSGNVVLWSTDDKIALFFGSSEEKKEFKLTSGAGTTAGVFKGDATLDNTRYAFYPFDKCSGKASDGKIEFKLPSIQSYVEGGIASGANPAVAFTNVGGDLVFKNLCGILKLQLTGTETIKRIVVISETTPLSGSSYVYPSSTPPDIRFNASAEPFVTLDLGDGVTLNTSPKTFYIVVPPVTVLESNPLTIKVEAAGGKMQKFVLKNSANSIARSKILGMPSNGITLASISVGTYNEGTGLYSGAGILMDLPIGYTVYAPVNCGYDATNFKFGKLYQWSRNEGCDYKETSYSYSDAGTGAEYDSSWNPTTNLWSSPATSQGPCPTGWRVPTSYELSVFNNSAALVTQGFLNTSQTTYSHGSTGNLAGRYYTRDSKTLFLPAGGHRYGDLNNCAQRNSYCFYWTSRRDIGTGYAAWLCAGSTEATSVYSTGSISKTYSVRCVQNL